MAQRYSVTSEVRVGIEVISLKDGADAVAEIAPALGNNCYAFRAGTAILEPVPFSAFRQRPTSYGIPILFPFPNRIRDGKFTFGGQEYQPDPPRHGFVRDKAWVVERHGASDADGAWLVSSFDAARHADRILARFPFPFRLEVTYRLSNGALEMSTKARNTGQRDMPVGFGIHPYFRLPARGVITVPANEIWELADSLPTGKRLAVEGRYDLRAGRPVEGLQLDDILTAVEADANGTARCTLEDPDSATETVVEFSARQFPHVVVYTPPAPRKAICIEPNTCPTDAFNLQARGIPANVITLGAGEEVTFDLRIYSAGTKRQAGAAGA